MMGTARGIRTVMRVVRLEAMLVEVVMAAVGAEVTAEGVGAAVETEY